MGRLDDKVAIITGAARGQGAHMAQLFAREGARVLVTDIRDEQGADVAAGIGDRAAYLHLDVTDQADWDAAVHYAMTEHGRLDILVNNAGINLSAEIAATTPEEYLEVVRVNQFGPWLGIRAVTNAMRTSGGGSIVNVGSVGSFMALPNKSAYLSSKYGLRGVTKCAASELGQHGIRVNAIQPGGIASDMTEGMPSATFADMPIPRIGLPSETAAAVLFFASDESTYCTGAELAVDGGRLVAPMATPPQPAAEKLGPPRIDA